MFMIASFFSGILAVLLSIAARSSELLVVSAPGFVIGTFFAFKYAMFDRSRKREEEHKRSRNRHRH